MAIHKEYCCSSFQHCRQTYFSLSEEVETDLLLSHLGKLVQEGEVLGQVFAVRFDAMLHDGQQRLHEASDAGPAADVLHRTVHVVGAETKQEGNDVFRVRVRFIGPLIQ